jgi:hypothetical protein
MTFAAEEAGKVLSQDARGRVLVSRERRESLLEEYDRTRDERSKVRAIRWVDLTVILRAKSLRTLTTSASAPRPRKFSRVPAIDYPFENGGTPSLTPRQEACQEMGRD